MSSKGRILDRILSIRNDLAAQMSEDPSNNDPVILSEWYAFSSWIHKLYNKAFASPEERYAFEVQFCQLETNRDRAKFFLNHKAINEKFKKYSHKFIKQNLDKRRLSINWQRLGRKKSTVDTATAVCDEETEEGEVYEYRHVIYQKRFEDYEENENMGGMSSQVSLALFAPKRRGLKAITNLDVGSVVSIDKAVAVWLSPQHYSRYCNSCLISMQDNKIICNSCKIAHFCSRKCFEEAKRTFHQYECRYLNFLQHASVVHFCIRIIGTLGAHRLGELEMEKDGKVFFEPGGDRTKRFIDLDDSDKNVPWDDMLSYAFTSTFVAHMLTKMEVFSIKCDHAQLVASLISIVITTSRNLFTVYDHKFHAATPEEMKNAVGLTDDMFVEGQTVEIGYGLYYAASLFNHSCTPNAHAIFLGNYIAISMQRPVKAGSEITISYGTTYPDTKYEDRQKKLLDNFYFYCICDRCRKDAELIDYNEEKKRTKAKPKKQSDRKKLQEKSNQVNSRVTQKAE